MIRKWWGSFRALFVYVTWYISAATLVFSLMSAYNTFLTPWLATYGIDIPFLVVLGGTGIIGIGLMVFERSVTVPGFFGWNNRRSWDSDNPQRRCLEDMQHKLDFLIELHKEKP